MKPTREFIEDALSETIVDPRSRALYELCFLHRNHFQDEIVADKLRMIVRVCAGQGVTIDSFSPEQVAHRLGRSGIDRWFASLATAEHLDPALVFEMHKRVMDVFDGLPEDQARAMAAKYLHYHFPELFYIYDESLESPAYDLGEGACGYLARFEYDPVYGAFFACCRKLAEKLGDPLGHRLTPRELDQVLRAWRDQALAGRPSAAVAMARHSLAA